MNDPATTQLDYEQLLKMADLVYMDVRFWLNNNAYTGLFGESAKRRILDIQRDIMFCLRAYGISYSAVEHQDFEVPLHMESNPNFDRYKIGRKTVVYIHYYLIVSKILWRQFGGTVVSAYDYCKPRNNVLDTENLATGLWDLGPMYLLEDPCGIMMEGPDAVNVSGFVKRLFRRNDQSIINDLGIPENHRVRKLSIGSIAFSNRNGGGARYMLNSNALVNPVDYLDVDGILQCNTADWVQGQPLISNNQGDVNVVLTNVDIAFDLNFVLHRTASDDANRMWYVGMPDVDNTYRNMASNSAAGIDAARGLVSNNNGSVYSPERPPLAREWSASNMGRRLTANLSQDQRRRLLVQLMNVENVDVINFRDNFSACGRDNNYVSNEYSVPRNKRLANDGLRVLRHKLDSNFDYHTVATVTVRFHPFTWTGHGNAGNQDLGPIVMLGHYAVSSGYLSLEFDLQGHLTYGTHDGVEGYWLTGIAVNELRNVTYNRNSLHLDETGTFTGLNADNFSDIASLPWNDIAEYEEASTEVAYPAVDFGGYVSNEIKGDNGVLFNRNFDNTSEQFLNNKQRLIRISKNDPVDIIKKTAASN